FKCHRSRWPIDPERRRAASVGIALGSQHECARTDGDMEQIGGKRIPLAEEANMQSAVVKRSIVISGHKTSVSLEDAFWRGLKEIATSRRLTLSDLVGSID